MNSIPAAMLPRKIIGLKIFVHAGIPAKDTGRDKGGSERRHPRPHGETAAATAARPAKGAAQCVAVPFYLRAGLPISRDRGLAVFTPAVFAVRSGVCCSVNTA